VCVFNLSFSRHIDLGNDFFHFQTVSTFYFGVVVELLIGSFELEFEGFVL